jgi:hypothetical protein
MRVLRAISPTLTWMSIFVATAALAANRGTLHIFSPVIVAGKQLSPGDYVVQWNGEGPNVDMQLVQRNRVLATTRALVRNLNDPCVNDSSVISVYKDGTHNLWQIFFSGKRSALEIAQDQ